MSQGFVLFHDFFKKYLKIMSYLSFDDDSKRIQSLTLQQTKNIFDRKSCHYWHGNCFSFLQERIFLGDSRFLITNGCCQNTPLSKNEKSKFDVFLPKKFFSNNRRSLRNNSRKISVDFSRDSIMDSRLNEK